MYRMIGEIFTDNKTVDKTNERPITPTGSYSYYSKYRIEPSLPSHQQGTN